jgi:hypothetical protein
LLGDDEALLTYLRTSILEASTAPQFLLSGRLATKLISTIICLPLAATRKDLELLSPGAAAGSF